MSRDFDSFRAKLQFIRIVDIFCNSKDILWNIGGSFIRNVLSQGNNNEELEIYLYSKEQSLAKVILAELKIINIIKTTNTHTSSKISCGIEILHDDIVYTFDVIFFIDCSKRQTTSFDDIVLTSAGLTINSLNPKHDECNLNAGIAILDRLIDIKSKTFKLSGTYLNMNFNINVRKKNAKLMRTQDAFINEGYTIMGDQNLKIFKSNDECPICYESSLNFTTLKCGHTFCVQCLASHMDKTETHSSSCPMCRALIILDF